jgi:hypothetical protein
VTDWRLRPIYAFVAVVAVLGGGLAASTALRPASVAIQPPANGIAAVSTATLVCPDPSAAGTGSTTTVSVGAASSPGAAGAIPPSEQRDGTIVVGGFDPDASSVETQFGRGPTVQLDVTATDADPVVVYGTGPVSPGLAAMQLTSTAGGTSRGLAAQRCAAPGTDAWFVGLGTEIGHTSRLHLANAEQAPAEIGLEIYGADGPVDTSALPDIVVAAGSTATYDLDALAPDQSALAVHVVARTGRVAAGVLDQQVAGLDPLGTDWLPTAAEPAGTVVVPGVPGGAGERVLQILAPGALDTQVELRLLTPDGPITPTGLEQIAVTAGEVISVPIAAAADGTPVAVELRADQPIVAGVRIVTGANGVGHDLAYTAGAPELASPTFLPGARQGDGWATRLELSAGDDDATLTITYVTTDTGAVIGSRTMRVTAGSTVELTPDVPADLPSFGVVVTPHDPGLRATLVIGLLRSGVQFLTDLPLVSEPLTVDVPRVRQDLSTGLRSR